MAIDFPNSPSVNQTYSVGARTWKYDGEKWALTTSIALDDLSDVTVTSPSANQVLSYNGSAWVNASGATMTVSDTPPTTDLVTGALWYESDTGSIYTYYDSQWIEIAPGSGYDELLATIQAKGDILAATGSQALSRVAVGANGTKLAANSSASTGVNWVADTVNTVVDAKGDLLVGTSNDTVARLAVGTNGTVLTADSTATGGVSWASQPAMYRNLVINGAMQVHQRGTSAAGLGTVTAYYTADRWQTNLGSIGTWTQTVENDAPTGSGFRKSLKMLCTTANSSLASSAEGQIWQKFEGQNLQSIKKGTASAEQVTLSFWVKSNVTGTRVVELYDNDNTRQCSKSYTVDVSGTWERKVITFPADTTGAFDNDNALSLYCLFWLAAGTNFTSGTLGTTWSSATSANRAVGQVNTAAATNNYWQITGVQLEVGPVATAYEFKPIDVEIAQCQRYYEKSYNIDVNPATNTFIGIRYPIIAASSGNQGGTISFSVLKRTTPTFNTYTLAGTLNKLNTDTVGEQTTNAIAQSQGSAIVYYQGGATNAGAVYCHYTADAEL